MDDKSRLNCPDCGTRLYHKRTLRVPDHMQGRECERVRWCPHCKLDYMTREVITRKLPS